MRAVFLQNHFRQFILEQILEMKENKKYANKKQKIPQFLVSQSCRKSERQIEQIKHQRNNQPIQMKVQIQILQDRFANNFQRQMDEKQIETSQILQFYFQLCTYIKQQTIFITQQSIKNNTLQTLFSLIIIPYSQLNSTPKRCQSKDFAETYRMLLHLFLTYQQILITQFYIRIRLYSISRKNDNLEEEIKQLYEWIKFQLMYSKENLQSVMSQVFAHVVEGQQIKIMLKSWDLPQKTYQKWCVAIDENQSNRTQIKEIKNYNTQDNILFNKKQKNMAKMQILIPIKKNVFKKNNQNKIDNILLTPTRKIKQTFHNCISPFKRIKQFSKRIHKPVQRTLYQEQKRLFKVSKQIKTKQYLSKYSLYQAKTQCSLTTIKKILYEDEEILAGQTPRRRDKE